jgi:2-polyprenyl-3-methyl-5-hydroxy-6-metoxy-1,4-benzoquinol methylase
MYRHLYPQRLVAAVKRRPLLHRAARRMRVTAGRLLPAREFPGIPGRIHPNDFMFDHASAEEVASYAERAGNVVANIEASLAAGGRRFDDVERWLDFGCGYGRVIRFLVEQVPRDRVWAGDVVREGVDFCTSEFGVHPLYSQPDLEALELEPFDFVYAISVLAHLNERNSRAMLRLLGDALRPRGIAMFTTHGGRSLEHPALYGAEYGERRDEIARAVAAHGMTFLPYGFAGGHDYGMAWHAKEWVEETVAELHGDAVRLIRFVPHGLDDHQDVFAFQRDG